MGLGRFSGGVETVRWLARKGARVTVTDLKTAPDLTPSLGEIGDLDVRLRLGGHRREDFTGTDLVVASPAVPPTSRYLFAAAEAGVPVTTELCLTMALLRCRTAWITGTCGKSTTTALLGEMLRRSRVPVHVGGNIGRALLGAAEGIAPGDTVLLEVSSFQLEWTARDGLCPDLAVITNLTPNHLDRHGTFERYVEAKAAALPPGGTSVLNRDDPASRDRLGPRAGSDVWWTSCLEEVPRGAFVREDLAVIREEGREETLCDLGQLRLLGGFNRANALMAAAAAHLLGAGTGGVRAAVADFPGLPHRLQDLGVRGRIRGVDDSKATTPEAACRALDALRGPIVLIAGGFDRGGDLGELARRIRERVRALVLVGEAAPRLRTAVGEADLPVCAVETLEAAVAEGLARCQAGDTLLLSPGHASWDMFASYEERGDRFRCAFLGRGVEGGG
jgi:UDP-N-acetylmuramoylalanine--D-glutamate ligase